MFCFMLLELTLTRSVCEIKFSPKLLKALDIFLRVK